jgi:hypothetical protein
MKLIILIIFLNLINVSHGFVKSKFIRLSSQNQQEIIVKKIITNLELGKVKSIYKYFQLSDKIKSTLDKSVIEIQEIKKKTKLSIVVVNDGDYKIYRCRYSNSNRILFQIDLIYLKDEAVNSKIINVVTKDSKVLAKEKEIRMKSNIPPSPPK